MNQADTAWMLISTALVLLMTPALAFFYGGLVRSKNALNTMMMSFISLGFVGVLWAVARVFARLQHRQQLDWRHVAPVPARRGLEPQGTIPHILFMCYQGTFCIITAALISGAIVERMRFSAYLTFITPVGARRLLARSRTGCGAAAGWPTWARSTSPAAPSCTSMPAWPRSSRRSSSASGATTRRRRSLPHNVPFTLLGAGLLWFGWFGFNAGSALVASPIAALAFTTTMLAPMGTLVVWTLLDYVRTGKPTAVGAATGIVVGLVAITPAAGFIGPMSAIALGAIAAVPSYFGLIVARQDAARRLARRGRRARRRRNGRRAAHRGVRAEGAQRRRQRRPALRQSRTARRSRPSAVVASIVYSGVVSFILLKIIGAVIPLRADAPDESVGLDVSQHGEEAYVQAGGSTVR